MHLLCVAALLLGACDCERREFEAGLDALGDEGDRLIDAIALPRFAPERGAEVVAPGRGLRFIVSMERVTVDESQLLEDYWVTPEYPPAWLGGAPQPSPRERGDPPPELPAAPLRILELDEGRIPSTAARLRGGALILPPVPNPSPTTIGEVQKGAIYADGRVPMQTLRELGAAIGLDPYTFVVTGPAGLAYLPRPSRFARNTGNCTWSFEDIRGLGAALEATSADPTEAAPLSVRAPTGSAGCAWQLALALVIRDDGYSVHTRDGALTPDCAHQRVGHQGSLTVPGHDRALLRECLSHLRELSPHESHIQILVFGETVTVRDVVEAWTTTLGTESKPLYDVIYPEAIYPTEG